MEKFQVQGTMSLNFLRCQLKVDFNNQLRELCLLSRFFCESFMRLKTNLDYISYDFLFEFRNRLKKKEKKE